MEPRTQKSIYFVSGQQSTAERSPIGPREYEKIDDEVAILRCYHVKRVYFFCKVPALASFMTQARSLFLLIFTMVFGNMITEPTNRLSSQFRAC